MGEIRKDNLHESLIEELNELANIDLSGKQDKTDESLLTESKDLVGAINELFQSANNGKELIASAIGEPLNAEDTFSAMSNDINSLLSTFKTNMMNNGIVVESSDRFKSLIDKITTMVEEGEGKGIQYASGNVTSTSSTTVYATSNVHLTSGYTIEVNNLTFKPYIVILTYGSATLKKINACAIHIDDVTNRYLLSTDSVGISTNTWGQYTLTPVYTGDKTHTLAGMRDNGFLLYSGLQSTEFTYYAIGVGEEDTTLRDSLASILQEEGVNVTEEDDMSSLITKVETEFNDKNNEISSLQTELSGKVTPAGTAVAANVLTGKTFINSTGSTITGNMANHGSKTVTPSTSTQTLAAGYYDKVTINSASLKLTASSSGSYNLAKTIKGLSIGFSTSENPPVTEVFECTVTGSGSVYVSLRLIGRSDSNSSGGAQFVVSRTRSGSKTEVAASDFIYFSNDQTINRSFTISGLLPGDVLTFGMRNRYYFYLGGTFYVDGVLCNVSY